MTSFSEELELMRQIQANRPPRPLVPVCCPACGTLSQCFDDFDPAYCTPCMMSRGEAVRVERIEPEGD